MENPGSLPFLLVTANVGSVFEDVIIGKMRPIVARATNTEAVPL